MAAWLRLATSEDGVEVMHRLANHWLQARGVSPCCFTWLIGPACLSQNVRPLHAHENNSHILVGVGYRRDSRGFALRAFCRVRQVWTLWAWERCHGHLVVYPSSSPSSGRERFARKQFGRVAGRYRRHCGIVQRRGFCCHQRSEEISCAIQNTGGLTRLLQATARGRCGFRFSTCGAPCLSSIVRQSR